MRLIIASVLVGSALLAGCSNTRRCEGEQPYQRAETLPTPGQIPGLTVPESPSALRIPAAPDQPLAYGQKVADKKGRGPHRSEERREGKEWAGTGRPRRS